MAIKSNLIIDQGSDYTITVSLTDQNGAALNLTGYTGRAQMRKSPTSTTNKDFTVSVNVSGSITLSMTSEYTSGITAGRYMYDAEIISANNTVTRVIEGIVTITPEITR